MPPLTASIQQLLEYQREGEWRKAGVPEQDIVFSRLCGMDARDVRVFRETTARDLLIVVRCPKTTARPWHGVLPPKPQREKDPSGTSGVLVTVPVRSRTPDEHAPGVPERGAAEKERTQPRLYVSDYDLMSAWHWTPSAFVKIAMTAVNGKDRGAWTPEAVRLAKTLNERLVSRIQHGTQDDWHSVKNRGVKPGDNFAAFKLGIANYLVDVAACEAYYRDHGLKWPYGSDGKLVLGS